MRCETAAAAPNRLVARPPPLREPSHFFWEGFRLAEGKLEVAGEKCDLRLQLRQKREESREKQEVAPKKLENTPWDILVGSLWWVFGAFLPPRGKSDNVLAASRLQRAEGRASKKKF